MKNAFSGTLFYNRKLKERKYIDWADTLLRESKSIVLRPNQKEAARMLMRGKIVQMETGEGKTYTYLPLILKNKERGIKTVVVTANEYLSERDSLIYADILKKSDISISLIKEGEEISTKNVKYASDVIFTTSINLCFDQMTSELSLYSDNDFSIPKQCIVVDEADVVMIDNASMPSRLNTESPHNLDYLEIFEICKGLSRNQYEIENPPKRSSHLNSSGLEFIFNLLNAKYFFENIFDEAFLGFIKAFNDCLTAILTFKAGRDYTVIDNKICLIDKITGRVAAGRTWGGYIKQFVEIAEGLPISEKSEVINECTIQTTLLGFDHICGMSGSIISSRREIENIYRIKVVEVPTHRKIRRIIKPDLIFRSNAWRMEWFKNDLNIIHGTGRPVLIVTQNEMALNDVASKLSEMGIAFNLLTGKSHKEDERVVSVAGNMGMVTLSTKLSGRGVDMSIGKNKQEADEIDRMGGMHIYVLGRFESPRYDMQIAGRTARQGRNGSITFLLSLEDELFRFSQKNHAMALFRTISTTQSFFSGKKVEYAIKRIQSNFENILFEKRRQAFIQDRQRSKFREIFFEAKLNILNSNKFRNMCSDMCDDEARGFEKDFRNQANMIWKDFLKKAYDINTETSISRVSDRLEAYQARNKTVAQFEKSISRLIALL